MQKFAAFLAICLVALAAFFGTWAFLFEMEKAQNKSWRHTPTFFFRNYLPDAAGVEFFKRTIKEDEVVTCYWILNSKEELLFHTCKQRSLYD